MEANKTILQMKYARIVKIFAELTKLPLENALDFLYRSMTYQLISNGIADMHCLSDGYLANLIYEEWQQEHHKDKADTSRINEQQKIA